MKVNWKNNLLISNTFSVLSQLFIEKTRDNAIELLEYLWLSQQHSSIAFSSQLPLVNILLDPQLETSDVPLSPTTPEGLISALSKVYQMSRLLIAQQSLSRIIRADMTIQHQNQLAKLTYILMYHYPGNSFSSLLTKMLALYVSNFEEL